MLRAEAHFRDGTRDSRRSNGLQVPTTTSDHRDSRGEAKKDSFALMHNSSCPSINFLMVVESRVFGNFASVTQKPVPAEKMQLGYPPGCV
jgi:hypothetical protein